jgi:hypothetical protein
MRLTKDGRYNVRGMPYAFTREVTPGSGQFDTRGPSRRVLCDEPVSVVQMPKRAGRVLCATGDGYKFWTDRDALAGLNRLNDQGANL